MAIDPRQPLRLEKHAGTVQRPEAKLLHVSPKRRAVARDPLADAHVEVRLVWRVIENLPEVEEFHGVSVALTGGPEHATCGDMDPQLFDLICEGIAAGTCPIADDADLRVLLAHLETLSRKDLHMAQQPPTPTPNPTPTNPTPTPTTPDMPRPGAPRRPRNRRRRPVAHGVAREKVYAQLRTVRPKCVTTVRDNTTKAKG